MFKRFLPITILCYVCIVIINWGCTKLDTTTLGSDLIPAVDNVNTFADTLDIITEQGIFNDSFKIGRTENHILGLIDNDPLFGETDARIYLQPKPSFYPFYFGNAGDSIISIDSVVLTLAYIGSWGDTSVNQQLKVHTIADAAFADSIYKSPQKISYMPSLGSVVGTASINIKNARNVVKINHGKDSVSNQVRIKLSDDFRNLLAMQDTSDISPNKAFRADSLFRKFSNGLAVSSTAGNAIMYINMLDTRTRLEFFIRKKVKSTGAIDTVFNTFPLLASSSNIAYITPSATANFVKRTYTSNITNPSPSELFLQTGPGTFATLKIPKLSLLNNRIVHRAQINIEQMPDVQKDDSIFSPPSYLYLDLKEIGTTEKWKPIYFDLNPNSRYDPDFKTGAFYFPPTGEIDYGYFGAFARKKTNVLGEKVTYYDINVTRYVQQMLTDGSTNYELRLFPGFTTVYPQYGTLLAPADIIPLDNPLALGRIRIKSGSYPDPEKKLKMRMTIIYSNL